jgi:tRNA(Ile)-lysidine synthase
MMLITHIKDFFGRHQLPISNCQPYLVAVSGGRDSMALVDAMYAQKIPFVMAHCNFQLRGAESDADEKYVQNWAEARHIACYSKRFDTQEHTDDQGISIQMAARQLRYQFFDRLLQQHALSHVITAHHASDVIETALYQFNRGSGLAGMSSIPEVNGNILRPLLRCLPEQIKAYVEQEGLVWREDSSNAKDDYARNFIRHQVVPVFLELNPSFMSTALQTVENLKSARRTYTWLLDQLLQQHLKIDSAGSASLPIAVLESMPNAQELLRHWLLPKAYKQDQINHLAAQLHHTGWSMQAGDWIVTVDRQHLILSSTTEQFLALPILKEDIMVRLGNGVVLFKTEVPKPAALTTDADTLYIDTQSITWPLSVRTWQTGDAFQPFGMDGKTQKIQDYLVHKKVSGPNKDLVRILANGDGRIIWVLGMRTDQRFAVPNSAKTVLKFTLVRN